MTILTRIKHILSPPIFEDEEKNYLAAILNIILLTLLVALVLANINNLLAANFSAVLSLGLATIGILVSLWLMHYGYLTLPCFLVPLMLLGVVTYIISEGNGIHSIGSLAYSTIIILASLLLGKRAPIIFALLCFAALAGVFYAEVNGILVTPFSVSTTFDDLINIGVILGITAVLLQVMVGNLTDSLTQARYKEQALAESNRQLQAIRVSLEKEIAERKQAETALIQARDQAIEVSRLKTELLAKVSHELRTPLGVILGYTEMLEAGLYGSVSDQQKQIMTKIINSSNYLTDLVKELLNQAQLDAGKLALEITTFAPQDLVETTLTKLNVLAQTKGLNLTIDIAPNLPTKLSGDLVRLQQILVNLVSNAIKFTQAGTVQVCLYQPDDHHWAIQISDTGPGIPVEAQLYIFEPFRQVDSSITRKHSGTGLGLSIVKQLTELMGGQVILDSKVGQGSTFIILLPLAPVQKEVR